MARAEAFGPRLRVLSRKIRVALTPRSSVLKSRTPNGAILLGTNRAGHGGRGLYVSGAGLEPEAVLLPRMLTRGSVLIDVGANTGLYSLTAAQHMANGSGIVLSLEPNPEVATMLRRSVQLNGFANVRLRVLCAGDQTGEATLWENYSRPNQFGMLALDESATGVSVLSVRLDDLVRWEKLESVDYIKIDVEGTEDDVLRGASETIDRFRPVIQVEDGIRPVNTLPSNYVQLRLAASPNRLLLPAESPALQLLRALPDVISVP